MTSRLLVLLTGVLAALVLGSPACALAAPGLDTEPQAGLDLAPVGARGGIAPEVDVRFESGTGFSAQQRADVRRLVRTAEVPGPIVVRAVRELPAGAGGSADAWAEDLKRREAAGLALVWVGDDSVPPYGATYPGGHPIETLRAEVQAGGEDPHDQFVRFVEVVTRPDAAERLMAAQDERLRTEAERRTQQRQEVRTEETSSPERRIARWFAVGGIVLLVLLAGALVVWSRVRSHRKASRIGRVASAAEAAVLADRAAADLLALGAAIDAERMDPHDDLVRWQKALDDYAEASRIHDRRRGVEDDRSVIELCARGSEHLEAAQRDP